MSTDILPTDRQLSSFYALTADCQDDTLAVVTLTERTSDSYDEPVWYVSLLTGETPVQTLVYHRWEAEQVMEWASGRTAVGVAEFLRAYRPLPCDLSN